MSATWTPGTVFPEDAYDGDVLQSTDGRCLTVLQAWHGEFGVTTRCIPGALKLPLDSGGFEYPGPVSEFQGRTTQLWRAGSLLTGDLVLSAVPGRSRFEHARARWCEKATFGRMFVLSDGYFYRLMPGREGGWWMALRHPATYHGYPFEDYLDAQIIPQDGFVIVHE